MKNQTPAPFSGEGPGISFADLSIFHLSNLHSSVSAAGQQGPPEATLAGTQVRDPHCLPVLHSNVLAAFEILPSAVPPLPGDATCCCDPRPPIAFLPSLPVFPSRPFLFLFVSWQPTEALSTRPFSHLEPRATKKGRISPTKARPDIYLHQETSQLS